MGSVTRRAQTRKRSTAEDIEAALSGAMERLLAGGANFTAVSVEQLAREAGIARSTFYLHFRDKGELVQRLMVQVSREIIESGAVWFRQPELANRAHLESALRGIVGTYERHRAIMIAVVETSAYDPQVAAMFQAMMGTLTAETRRGLRRARQALPGRPELPAEVGDALTWAVERCCHQVLTGRPVQRERLVQALTHILWTSIYAPP